MPMWGNITWNKKHITIQGQLGMLVRDQTYRTYGTKVLIDGQKGCQREEDPGDRGGLIGGDGTMRLVTASQPRAEWATW